ncbi:diguanylate cyclase domain-containing protein [Marinobacter xestospongiae]|uniref:diguanylate cyclase n=1 Tax=Marinobacter xestospongiae TaxID=994319 RepID=A0ABU3VXL6_9GAMM|nr:diguanylate cyclase [Marinobacter xestospongiae]MDV2079013.1 diguanylate cyclase [Marinobacter xestospongiae]
MCVGEELLFAETNLVGKCAVTNEFAKTVLPQTVLLVDDVPANLDVLLEHLRSDGVRLLAATSGLEALALARQNPPDLILLDVMMPNMDGYEVIRQLKGHTATRDIPVIFVTAMSDAVDEAKGLALGAVDYIAKPFVVPVLKARVNNHLELKRKSDLLAQLALVDGLTGIANRRQLERTLESEWARCQRSGYPLSVIMIDIDYFKAYNDHHGHGQGDQCLRSVAKALHGASRRAGELLARYGGEEFAVVLPNTDAESARQTAEALRACVLGLKLPHHYSPVGDYVSISVGVATTMPSQSTAVNRMMEMADTALYQAKKAGRNCVRSAGAELESVGAGGSDPS